jgi:beta-1,2-mannobiose phosphorylase / 1,2-beta-oligomannan phosphorylase
MRPDPNRKDEVEGVLNPGAVRGPDGKLYLYPRLVAKGNFSRIGIAAAIFNDEGDPVGVERLGYALEPSEPYELRPQDKSGGCEDPRVTFVGPLGCYVMAYVAWGPAGPRVALAVSRDCLNWDRLGLVDFQPDDAYGGARFNSYYDKDAAFVPDVVELPDGTMMLGMLHRPVYSAAQAPYSGAQTVPSIWLSCCDLDAARRDLRNLCVMTRHVLVAAPQSWWEALRIGVGTPLIRTRLGYMTIYHGVSGKLARTPTEPNRIVYEAGVLLFRRKKNRLFVYRSMKPIFIPELGEEKVGTVDNVVFPTGIDHHSNEVYDVYYGMADKYIGAARITLPRAVEYEETELPEVARLRLLKP